MLSLVLLIFGCPDDADPAAKLTADQCLATYGDHCGCQPRCLSPAEMEELSHTDPCDLACGIPEDEITWSCVVVDGACAVAE